MRFMAAIRRRGARTRCARSSLLTVAIQQIRSIKAGASCGYNAQWTATRPTRLATLLIGYADGLPRGAGATDTRPGAEVAVAGRRCALVGRVSMDLTIVDVTDLPEDAVKPGDPVEFFGPTIDLDDFGNPKRHDRLSPFDEPRAALSAGPMSARPRRWRSGAQARV